MGTNERALCPHCGTICVKQHDVPRLWHRVELVLYKRRFWCLRCHKAFTESDSACGRRKRTTVRLREEIGKLACSRPLMHVASHYEGGARFVQGCLEAVASIQLAKRGLSLEESGPLPTPRFLGIDEFARRKGHRYDTILCDLEARQVLANSLVLGRIAHDNDISVSQAEIDAELKARAAEAGADPKVMRQVLQDQGEMNQLKHSVFTRKVMDYLKGVSVIKEAR